MQLMDSGHTMACPAGSRGRDMDCAQDFLLDCSMRDTCIGAIGERRNHWFTVAERWSAVTPIS